MDIITGARQSGKTRHLIERAMQDDLIILTENNVKAELIISTIVKMNEGKENAVYPWVASTYGSNNATVNNLHFNVYVKGQDRYMPIIPAIIDKKFILDDAIILGEMEKNYENRGIPLAGIVICQTEFGHSRLDITTCGGSKELAGY